MTDRRSPPGRAAAASMAGAVLDWYDFFVYGLVAALVFPKLFFPADDPKAATLLTFATFGVGFLARPLGGVLFGHFGDRVGRKAMLVVTLVMMGLGTACIGLLPTYGSAGVAAPVMLVALRFLQGIAIGGEWAGAALMAVEHAPQGRRGFFGSFVQVGASVGLMIATAVVALVNGLTREADFLAWGWRIPFLLSLLVALGGFWLRRAVDESPEFVAATRAPARMRSPLLQALRARPGAFLAILALRLAELTTFYMVTVFCLNYGVTLGLKRQVLLNATLAVGVVAMATIPAAGALADRIGRRPVYVAGALIGVAGAFPLFWALESHSVLWITLAFVLVANLAHDPVVAVQQSLFTEMFEPAVRYSGAGFAYQLASALAGGFTPLIAAALAAREDGGWHGVALYLAGACLASAVTGMFVAKGRASGC